MSFHSLLGHPHHNAIISMNQIKVFDQYKTKKYKILTLDRKQKLMKVYSNIKRFQRFY